MRCRTLVDELRNLSLTYRKGGKVEVKSNDARNFKEDCHRLWGEPGSWISYQVNGHITAVRVYAFGDKGEPSLEFRAGIDGGKGDALTAHAQDFYGGKELYNFHWPRLYTLDAMPGDGSGVAIRFQQDTQIARVEIEYE